MSRDIEQLLRDGLDRLTAGASVPAGMAERARQANRRRRFARGGLATGGVAAVAGTIALAVAVAGGGGGGLVSTASGHARPAGPARPAVHHVQHVQTVADIVHKASRALDTSNLIMVSMSNATVVSLEHGANGHRRIVTMNWIGYSYKNRMAGYMFKGPNTFAGPKHVRIADSTLMSSMKLGTMSNNLYKEVDYYNHTWAQSTRREKAWPPKPTSLACSSRQKLSTPDATLRAYLSTSPASIKSALACGGLVKAGTETVQGVHAIRLTSTSKLTSHSLVVDVSPDTFLPVRVIFGNIEMDYRWLQPTAANLAKLTPQIPRGFRQTHKNVAH